jgi:hypothetical protein
MKRMVLPVALALALGVTVDGCKKKETPPPPPPAPGGMMPGGMPGGMGEGGAPHGPMGGGGAEKQIVVPDAIKGAWKGAKIEVDFKDKKAKKQFSVDLNSEFKVPDSPYTLKVGSFLPNFTMAGDTITSKSNDLENPALGVEVFEGGKSVWKGWLYQRFPAIHSFPSEKIGFLLIEGVKK